MKTINKFRSTNTYCVNGTDLRYLACVWKFFQDRNESLIAVANDKDDTTMYTVRVTARGMVKTGEAVVTDHVLVVTPWNSDRPVRIVESEAIVCATGPLPKAETVAAW